MAGLFLVTLYISIHGLDGSGQVRLGQLRLLLARILKKY